jgi:uncharacterized protein (DUF2141 family)
MCDSSKSINPVRSSSLTLRFRMKCLCSVVLAFLVATGLPIGVSSPGQAQSPQGCTLRVHVDGLRNAKGVVGAELFRSADGWPEDVTKSARHEAAPIADGQRQTTVVIDGVVPGDYGLAVLHDENKNMKLDKNMFGYPKEGFGFANNPHIGFGPPAFRTAVFHVGCPVTEAQVHIIYK